mgnify:CR=1 FL=1|tara:strand:+ start:198 stop:632 length:435 start_codon:yes stop_codon:yes gene_type:complete
MTNKQDYKLEEEGKILLDYVSGNMPSQELISRYVNVIKKNKNTDSMSIPKIICMFPSLLIFFEKKNFFKQNNSELNRRILIALAITEASIENFDKFILSNNKNLFISFIHIAIILISDLIIKIVRPLLLFFILFFINKKFRSYL